VPNAAARRIYEPESAHVARTFLAELRQTHRKLLAYIQQLESMSYHGEPDPTVLSTTRWRLGQASLARRLLAGRICDYFEGRCEPAQIAVLQSLRSADREMLRVSASHLGKWTAATIAADWPAYCRDGQAIRRRAHDHIALEQRVLYPLLEQAARI
jgi:hypothetical protein